MNELVTTLLAKRLHPAASLPRRSKPGDAGFDLYWLADRAHDLWLQPDDVHDFGTGIAVAIPGGFYGRVSPRSGMAAKGIDVLGGVIDAGYRGEVRVLLVNHGVAPYPVAPGDRIAQLVVERIYGGAVEEVDELPGSERGDGGFGSTGR